MDSEYNLTQQDVLSFRLDMVQHPTFWVKCSCVPCDFEQGLHGKVTDAVRSFVCTATELLHRISRCLVQNMCRSRWGGCVDHDIAGLWEDTEEQAPAWVADQDYQSCSNFYEQGVRTSNRGRPHDWVTARKLFSRENSLTVGGLSSH